MAKPEVSDWDETAANNADVNSVNIAEGCPAPNVNNALREIMAATARMTGEDTIASATTTDLSTVPGGFVNITGTTPITGLGTLKAGVHKLLLFAGALTLTHNATSLILPGSANITTAAGDVALVVSEGSGNWRCAIYFRAAVGPDDVLAADGSATTPSIRFSADTNTGIYRSSADNISISTGGVARFTVGASAVVPTLPLQGSTGSVSAPSYSFSGDTDSGVYSGGANAVGIASGGTEKFYVSGSVTRIDGINDLTTGSAANVFIDSADGALARSTSSRRYKDNIKDTPIALADLSKLRPVDYTSKGARDNGREFTGLISEEINQAGFSRFVEFNEAGQEEGIMYAPLGAVGVAILAKELQHALKRIEQLESAK